MMELRCYRCDDLHYFICWFAAVDLLLALPCWICCELASWQAGSWKHERETVRRARRAQGFTKTHTLTPRPPQWKRMSWRCLQYLRDLCMHPALNMRSVIRHDVTSGVPWGLAEPFSKVLPSVFRSESCLSDLTELPLFVSVFFQYK